MEAAGMNYEKNRYLSFAGLTDLFWWLIRFPANHTALPEETATTPLTIRIPEEN
jgi:hypothetical protein